jgi:hypothetical protein
MDNKEKLLDLIDGRLDVEQEQALFSELSYNDALRADFKSYMTIDKAIKSDSDSLAPSTAATNSVFASLGYTLPPDVAPQPVGGGGFFSSKMFTGIAGLVVGAIFTFTLVNIFFDQSDENIETKLIQDQNQISTNLESTNSVAAAEPQAMVVIEIKNGTPIKTHQIFSRTQKQIPRVNLVAEEEVNSNAKEVIKLVPLDEETESTEIKKQEMLISNSSIENHSFDSFVFNPNEQSFDFAQSSSPIKLTNNQVAEQVNDSKAIGMSVEIKNHEAWHFPRHTISPSETPIFNKLGIAVLFETTDNLELGFGIRRENFYLEYDGNELGINYNYFQNPNLVSYGVIARYRFAEMSNFEPFVQTELGINSYGIIGRLAFGGELVVFKNISFIFNIESGLFVYSHQINMYTAKKIGFEYGVKFNF